MDFFKNINLIFRNGVLEKLAPETATSTKIIYPLAITRANSIQVSIATPTRIQAPF